MNDNKQALLELRQWMEKWNTHIELDWMDYDCCYVDVRRIKGDRETIIYKGLVYGSDIMNTNTLAKAISDIGD